jgi:hypothetical protein
MNGLEKAEFVVKATLVTVLAVVSLLLVLGLVWHLVYAAKGRPKYMYPSSYLEFLLTRAAITMGALGGVCVVFLIGCMVLQSYTAKLPSALVIVQVDSTSSTGKYVRVSKATLPESAQAYLGNKELLFIQANPDPKTHASRLIRVVDDAKVVLDSFPTITLMKTRWTRRFPIQSLRWLGPIYDREDFIVGPDGKERLVSGIMSWTAVKRS